MPWERGDGMGLYYTVTISRKGKPKRMYFGRPGSPPAELAAAIVGIRAIDQELNRRYWRAARGVGLTDDQKAGIEAMSQFFRGMQVPVAQGVDDVGSCKPDQEGPSKADMDVDGQVPPVD